MACLTTCGGHRQESPSFCGAACWLGTWHGARTRPQRGETPLGNERAASADVGAVFGALDVALQARLEGVGRVREEGADGPRGESGRQTSRVVCLADRVGEILTDLLPKDGHDAEVGTTICTARRTHPTRASATVADGSACVGLCLARHSRESIAEAARCGGAREPRRGADSQHRWTGAPVEARSGIGAQSWSAAHAQMPSRPIMPSEPRARTGPPLTSDTAVSTRPVPLTCC